MNKNKGIISIGLIVAIVLGIIVISGSAYYLGKSSSNKEVNNSTIPTNYIVEQPFPNTILTMGGKNPEILKGYVIVSGTYITNEEALKNGDDFGGGNLVFNIDNKSINKIPLYIGDLGKSQRMNDLNFINYKDAKIMLNTSCSPTGNATIVIRDYELGSQETASETTLDKVIDFSPDNKACSEINVNTTTPQNSVKASTVTIDPKDKNISIYTSYNLGVQFSYLNNGDFGLTSKPIESGDRISLDGMNGSSYIRVFQKLSGESIEQTIKRIIPEPFSNINCGISKLNSNSYIIWDKRVPINQYGQDDADYTSSDGTYLKNICLSKMSFPFRIDPNFPNIVYYMEYSTQSPDYFANESGSKQWTGTVHFISK
jgi:hypothetical protein